jgi:hypothetical protein
MSQCSGNPHSEPESIAMRRATDYLTETVRPFRLKSYQYRILLALALNDCPMTEFDIAQRLHLEPELTHCLILDLRYRNLVEDFYGRWLGLSRLGQAFFSAASELITITDPVEVKKAFPAEVQAFPIS